MRACSIVLAILLPCLAVPSSDASQRLTILHSNDVHGHLRPFSYPEIESPGSGSIIAGSMMSEGMIAAFDLPARRDIGGIARRATLAARIRADLAKQGTPVWLIDAGDFYYYSAFSDEYHGVADVVAMNRAGYDFATLGNHEFEDSLAQLRRLIADARFDFLCANVADSATGRPLTKRYEVRRVGAVRVGIFGLVTGSAGRKPAAREGLAIEDPLRAAPALVARLRGPEQVDIVVLISHCGDSVDRRLAREVRGIDVIVGSHWHTRLPQGELVRWSDELKPDEVNGTIIVQAGQWGGELGRLDLLLEKNAMGQWRVDRYQERLIPVTSQTPDDPAVAAVLDSLWAPFAARYDEVLATATADFTDRGDDLARNNLVADVVRAGLGVEVEFESPGGMHLPIPSGPVTRAMLADLDQHPYTIVTFRMRGSEIRRFVQRSKPVASGLRYRMFCGRFEAITVGDAPLDDARVYSCAVSSALAGRLDGFETLERRDTKRLWSDVVIAAIRKAGTIAPAYDGRRVVVDTLRAGTRPE
jgi:2',3'-cyclic-nucleotide 2'-phosphodiesterase (5'-nucleotidase family)